MLASNRVEMQEATKGINSEGWHITPPNENIHEKWMLKSDDYNSKGILFDSERSAEDALRQKLNLAPDEAIPPRDAKAKFAQYQLPGGENYREMLFTLPQKAADERAYSSSHWNEPNVLAHVRFNDRDINGKRTLFVEEVQSDWHQAGRKKGYKEPFQEAEPRKYTLNDFDVLKNSNGVYEVKLKSDPEGLSNGLPWAHSNEWGYSISFDDFIKDIIKELNEKSATRAEAINQKTLDLNKNRVPNAPLKSDWPSMVMKRMIRYASDNGYDQIAWTSGATQAGRYDLSKQIKHIDYAPTSKGTIAIDAKTHSGEAVDLPHTAYKPEELDDVLGKEVADKIRQGVGKKVPGSSWMRLDTPDLRVGGEGMKAFYDRELPQRVNKIVKKFGTKTQSGLLRVPKTIGEAGGEGGLEEMLSNAAKSEPMKTESVHVLPLSPELKGVAQREGFSLFARGGRAMARGARGAKGAR